MAKKRSQNGKLLIVKNHPGEDEVLLDESANIVDAKDKARGFRNAGLVSSAAVYNLAGTLLYTTPLLE